MWVKAVECKWNRFATHVNDIGNARASTGSSTGAFAVEGARQGARQTVVVVCTTRTKRHDGWHGCTAMGLVDVVDEGNDATRVDNELREF